MPKRLKNAEDIKVQPFYSDVDFDAVYERRVVPPKIPKLTEPGDAHYFDEYGDENSDVIEYVVQGLEELLAMPDDDEGTEHEESGPDSSTEGSQE